MSYSYILPIPKHIQLPTRIVIIKWRHFHLYIYINNKYIMRYTYTIILCII